MSLFVAAGFQHSPANMGQVQRDGGIATVALRAVVQTLPWAAIVVGILLVGYGVAVFAGRAPTLRLPGPSRAVEGRGAVSTVAFGSAYATASLSCTLAVFLSVIGSATATASPLGGPRSSSPTAPGWPWSCWPWPWLSGGP